MSTPSPLVKNILERISPLLLSNSRLGMFSPEQKIKLDAEYRDALGIGDKATFSDDALDTFSTGSIRVIESFEKTKCPNNKTITENLSAKKNANNQDDINAVKAAVQQMLAPSADFVTAQKDYKDAVGVFEEMKKLVPKTLRAEALITLMAEIKDEAIKAAKDQQKKELDGLEATFKDPNFRESLKKTLFLKDDAGLDTVKKNMSKDLEESHKKQLDELTKSTSDSMTKLHKATELQNLQLIFIANLHKNNKEMRDMINQKYQEKRRANNLPDEPTAAVWGIKPNHMTISGLTIEDLKVINLTGKEIEQSTPGVFEIKFSNSISDFLYNQDPRQNHLTDFTAMAEALRASGYDTCNIEISEMEDPEVSLERARQAYEGAINAGFPKHGPKPDEKEKDKKPDHIVVNVNGKVMRAEELFKGHEARLSSLHNKADSIEKSLKNIHKFTPRTLDTALAREELVKAKKEAETKAKAEAEAEAKAKAEAAADAAPAQNNQAPSQG